MNDRERKKIEETSWWLAERVLNCRTKNDFTKLWNKWITFFKPFLQVNFQCGKRTTFALNLGCYELTKDYRIENGSKLKPYDFSIETTM